MRPVKVGGGLPQWALVTVLVGAIALLGCGGSHGKSAAAAGASASHRSTTTTNDADLRLSPAGGTTDVALNAAVTVSAVKARLSSVTMSAAAAAVTGTLDAVTGVWKSAGPLLPATTYSVSAMAMDTSGRPVTRSWTLTTLTPAKQLKVRVSPLDGSTVGVGQPLAVYLTAGVADHAAIESHLQVTTTPAVLGSWHWFSATELHWRPAAYWAAGTKVSLAADLAGWDAGGGVWGVESRNVSFTIGDAHVSTVDAATHQMTVTNNGQTVKTVPVSTGRDKYPTKSGIHVVLDKEQTTVMDSSTVGIPVNSPDGYKETVFWNTRISDSGEFVHAAPWSVGSQGHANVSHGCVNLSTADATWFFKFSRLGDVVVVVNTPQKLSATNGFGDWNIPYAQWAN
jgi:lipoprotein-anchoring transpeptidase ErfK/SrfK